MARKISIDTSKLRKALAPEVAKAERAVKAAEKKAGPLRRAEGTAAPDPQTEKLNHARQMLKALRTAQMALEACCCDPTVQNCDFEI